VTTEETASSERGYRALFEVKGFTRLFVSLSLGRIAGQMLTVALVLFVLSRYHSPQLAGAATLLLTLPGLLLSPIAGALLDRYGRAPLVTVDYVIAAVTLFLIAGLSARGALPPQLLLVICGVSSLTAPLSVAGARSLFPIVVPSHLWERANAFDSTSYVLASLVGAPVAGVIVAAAGGEWALAAAGALFVVSAAAMLTVQDPGPRRTDSHVLSDAWAGLVYVVRNRTLAGIALSLSLWGIGWGILTIAVPVLLLGPLHQGPSTVGYLWGVMGAAGIVSGLASGRIKTLGREKQLMIGSLLIGAVATALLPLAGTVVLVAVSIFLFGATNGPFDIAFITLRQRRTDPAVYGRVFAVSIALNTIGTPIGAALAGPLIAWSLSGALWVAVIAVLLAVLPVFLIPSEQRVSVG
jgi:predicted MFS family arabinose efflux permease